ncbi:uncharacterized protein Z518_11347 [Rhinocladiella mackenziei CBS 650.93]|uniref:DUF7721 domain-containing protein n=1 Tax=Rhinocladiella mackenziei CBS 650.93 TaxID=1442369 RepID=A0A0D2IRH3_9EURO|nr:uncharacterized protein Z518_11347 [Rhinocladiella mackenziei CBS 650.93]KIW99359.1 hypothetical protein Z518_11347 [Rhinocladiella mackenziei CBS 650.93]
MSYYNDDRRGDPREYGGGGRDGNNYYDQSQRYDDSQQGGGYERQSGGRDDEYGDRRQQRGYGGRDEYGGGQSGGYGEERRHEVDGGSSGGGGSTDFDQDEIMRHSRQHDSGDSSLFSQAMSFLNDNKHSAVSEDIDEGRIQQSHQQLYQRGGGGQQHDASSLGRGAAMQALKMFTGSGSGSGGSGSQSQMIAMAMQEASKLFDTQNSQGNVQSGTDKQSVINQAAKMALQMYLKGQGGGSGGSGLMNLASKFLS